MKRTRRIEIVRYTGRMTRSLDDISTAAGAHCTAVIDALSLPPLDELSEPDQTDKTDGRTIRNGNRTSRSHQRRWLDWLLRRE